MLLKGDFPTQEGDDLMNKLSRKDLLLVGLMLFSLFFGAGNLIFPPFLGQRGLIHGYRCLVFLLQL